MCTVSWLFHADGYDLFVNRDELRSRLDAQPPRRFFEQRSAEQEAAYLAPVDGDAGGTWVSVNDLGLAVCLLNRYPADRDGVFESRGVLVRDLAPCASVAEAAERLHAKANTGQSGLVYRPFTLLLLAPETAPAIFLWDGELLAQADEPAVPVLTSSSRETLEVGPARRRLWLRTVGEAPALADALAFHRSHEPERGIRSPCMHRDDARTVSFTHVRVTSSAVGMSYAAGPPCRVELGQPLTLIRRSTPRRQALGATVLGATHAVPVG